MARLPLRVLHLEDHPRDTALVQAALRSHGLSCTTRTVSTREAFIAALQDGEIDLILSDYSLPSFDGLSALKLATQIAPKIPFILVSGTLGEEAALMSLRGGGPDYVLKHQLDRLGPAVLRALKEGEERRTRHAAEEALRQNERRLAEAQKLAHIGSWEWEAATGVMTWSEELYRILDVDPAQHESSLDAFFERVHSDDRDRVMRLHQDGLHCRESFGGEHRVTRADGTVRVVHFENEIVCDEHGEPIRMVGTIQDVTEQRKTEQALRELAAIVESSQDAISSETLEGAILSWNRGAERLYGHTEEEIRGRPTHLLIPPERIEEHSRFIEIIRSGGRVENIDTLRMTKHGRRVEVSLTYSPILDKLGRITGASVIARDATERKKAEEALRRSEEQLRHAQKMEAVGRLAGGVAHDFNNLLTIILGTAAFLGERLGEDGSECLELEQIRRAAERATALTRQLLAFSRRQVLEPRAIDLASVVADMKRMLHRLIGEDIELETEHMADLGWVLADPGQIEQVILNLAINARDAMPQGGRLKIETRNAHPDEIPPEDRSGDRFVVMVVTDSGCGMDRETLSHIFEPFFTTKELGKGTGLGLATVYGIVSQSGGRIVVNSESGKGTTFSIYLPRVDPPAAATLHEPSETQASSGHETILLVEDDDQVRGIGRRSLERQGYRVIVASDGLEALAKAREHPGPIDLLLTDVVMPRLSGRELASEITRMRPETRVIYVSGYTDDAIVHHGVLDASLAFLQKPFTLSSLTHKVREVLDRAA